MICARVSKFLSSSLVTDVYCCTWFIISLSILDTCLCYSDCHMHIVSYFMESKHSSWLVLKVWPPVCASSFIFTDLARRVQTPNVIVLPMFSSFLHKLGYVVCAVIQWITEYCVVRVSKASWCWFVGVITEYYSSLLLLFICWTISPSNLMVV